MSDVAHQGAHTDGSVTCRGCGAENQIQGQPCAQCDRFIVELLIPYFYYLLALGSPESSRGYGNWPKSH